MKSTIFRVLATLLAVGWAAPIAAGVVEGTVIFEGKAPTMRPVPLAADPRCEALHKDAPLYFDWLVLGEGQAVANVLVHLAEGVPEKTYPVPTDVATLDQKGCQYSPHVLAVRAGQKIRVLNPDETSHNVHFLPKENREKNMALAPHHKEKFHTLREAEPVFEIVCDVHSWMKAYCAVFDHPFYSVTGKDGRFAIEGLDPGEYEIEVWHEVLGVQRRKVTVPADGDVTEDFVLTRPKK